MYGSVCPDETKQYAKALQLLVECTHNERKEDKIRKKTPNPEAKLGAKLCTIGGLEVRIASTFLTKIIPLWSHSIGGQTRLCTSS